MEKPLGGTMQALNTGEVVENFIKILPLSLKIFR
jgi:hypothetical protein